MNMHDDLGLRIPLHGVQLIEASAGTGKTFTLATLYTRLVIEARIAVPEILAVTFTLAATAELRARLRERLMLALALAQRTLSPTTHETAHALTAVLVEAALASESRDALVHRLRAAIEAMDLAPIHTIHAFCQRALDDHALDAAQPPATRELVNNENALRLEVATEFWRSVSYDDADADTLLEHWPSPQRLADDLRQWLACDTLAPVVETPPARAEQALQAAAQALREVALAHAESAWSMLQEAFDGGVLHKPKFPIRHAQTRWMHLIAWRDTPDAIELQRDKLDWFTSDGLRERAKSVDDPRLPQSPLFDAIDAWFAAGDALQRERARRHIALIHRACGFARQRLRALKMQRGQQGFDDLIGDTAAALQGPNGALFAARLRKQYRVALVDEFQDTDPVQWDIFRHVFADARADEDTRARALFLIGDPKQSIYRFRGGDVFTYLVAAARADARHSLVHNFRSRPSVLRAVEALFALGGDDAFAQPGIGYVPVTPGGSCGDGALRIDDAVAPALTVLRLSATPKQSIEDSRDAAAVACAAQIHTLLHDTRAGRVQRGEGADQRSLRPRDIAVLVRSNRDALRMQATLAAAGVPSVAPARDSVFASDEAEEWRRVLLAIASPGDEGRLRAALATPLLGWTAADIATLDTDASRQRGVLDLAQHWRQRLDRHGLLALGSELCADNAPRLLALVDGERRLANHLQLLDTLQCDPAASLGARALLDALERRMRDADGDNEDEQLRLESDADRVVILTLHRAKGLEFDLVFLPFVATDGVSKPRSVVEFHDGQRRIGWLPGAGDDTADAHAVQQQSAQERAESLRLLYVGLTRARLALWVVWGESKCANDSAFAWLLHRDAGTARPMPVDAASIDARLALLQARAGDAVAVRQAATALPPPLRPSGSTAATPPAAVAQRVLAQDWWVYSYSQLAREDGGAEERGAQDEDDPLALAAPTRSPFVGARFGNSLHHALEHVDVPRWADWSEAVPPPGERLALLDALRSEGFGADDDGPGIALLVELVRNTLNTRLPEGVRLVDLPATARRNELEFHLGLAPVAVPTLLATLHRHGIALARNGFGLRRRIEGLLTGRIDLVYRHADRYYVLDFKSNVLPDYAPATLAQAVRDSEYDLQYALYAVALHRWLRFRLGERYVPERDFGGVRYLYCRGLDPARGDGAGIHAPDVPLALLDALDAVFAGRVEVAA